MPTLSGSAGSSFVTDQTSPHTFAFTMPATGARRALVVQIQGYDGSGGTIDGITFNGVSLTKVGSTYGTTSSTGSMEQYLLVDPDTGTHDIVVSFTHPGGNFAELNVVVSAWVDVDQASPVVSSTGGTGTGTAPSLTQTVTGSNVALGFVTFYSGGTSDPTESDTLLAEVSSSASASGANAQYGDGSLSWTIASANYVTAGLVLAHDGGSGGGGDVVAWMVA